MFDLKEAFTYVKEAIEHYRKNPAYDSYSLDFMALLADNFLNCCYHEKNTEYLDYIMDFMKSLPRDPRIGFYNMVGIYYQALLEENLQKAKSIAVLIKEIGYYSLISDTIEETALEE